MIARNGDDSPTPSPELLAAYADGELDFPPLDAYRAQVENWLAARPEAAAEIAAQRRLRQFYRSALVPEPGESAWSDTLMRVEAGLARSAAPKGGWNRAVALAAAATAAAAAIWLVLTWLPRGSENTPAPSPREDVVAIEPFPVATADEVEILSVAGADTGSLVVGQLPLQGPMVLVGPGDVTLTSAPADVIQNGPAPMIWNRTEGEQQDHAP